MGIEQRSESNEQFTAPSVIANCVDGRRGQSKDDADLNDHGSVLGFFSRATSCTSSKSDGGECYSEFFLNDWDNLCDKNTGCRLPGLMAVYPDAIEACLIEGAAAAQPSSNINPQTLAPEVPRG